MHAYTEIVIACVALVAALGALFAIRKFKRVDQEEYVDHDSAAQPDIGSLNTLYEDEIVAIRKKADDGQYAAPQQGQQQHAIAEPSTIVMSVMAKPGKMFSGYELLQAILSQGFRFGEMNIFHRHQQPNGKSPILFSLASATEPGTFDIKAMGSYSCVGLTLFMQLKGERSIDGEAFGHMHHAATALAEELDGELVDDRRKLLTAEKIVAYKSIINPAA